MSESTTSQQKAIRVKITISKDSMSATLVMRAPTDGSEPITLEEIQRELEITEIESGIDQEAIERAITEEKYNQAITIALGRKPERGEPSEFKYHFNSSSEHRPDEDEHGNIDYKNIHFIQSVGKDDVLVTKTPPTKGKPGINLFGKEIEGPTGVDLPFKNGNNTKISEDDLTLIATTDGAIVFTHGTVSINDVTVVKGDLDFNVGNIDSRGSVKIMGNVRAGFTVISNGDIEVNGNAEDCTLTAGGNIFVKGGLIGKGEGLIKAKGDITAKFAEGHRLEAGNDIVIGEEIINCDCRAKETLKLTSRVGKIIGGKTEAGKEIELAIAGSNTGTSTELTIPADPELMAAYNETTEEIERITSDSERIGEALVGLYKLKFDDKLTSKQAEILKQFKQFRDSAPETLKKLEAKKSDLEEKLAQQEDKAIVVKDKLYAGVIARFGIVYKQIMDTRGATRMELAESQVIFLEPDQNDSKS